MYYSRRMIMREIIFQRTIIDLFHKGGGGAPFFVELAIPTPKI